MKKQLGAIFLLAGTAIGSGMISLPIVLAKFGILNTCLIMLVFAALTYATALIRSDLNLKTNAGATLGDVGCALDCLFVGKIGNFFLILLHFALMSAYLFGFSSISCVLFENLFGCLVSIAGIVAGASLAIALLFLIASETIVYLNKYLFIALFGVLITLIISLLLGTNIEIIPEQAGTIKISDWSTLVPVIFTSFGFQGSIHSMTKFAQNDKLIIKRACLWGSLVPAFVYIIWTAAILLVVANTDANFFQAMLSGQTIEIGALVEVLSKAAGARFVQIIVWGVSIFAILTSILGVGLALLDLVQQLDKKLAKWKIVALTVFAPAIVSIFVPNAFIRILNVSGIILAIIAIIVPVILSLQMQKRGECELLLRNRALIGLTFLCGTAIILLGIIDLF